MEAALVVVEDHKEGQGAVRCFPSWNGVVFAPAVFPQLSLESSISVCTSSHSGSVLTGTAVVT